MMLRILIGLSSLSLLSCFPWTFFPLELLSHFRLQFFLMNALFFVGLLCARKSLLLLPLLGVLLCGWDLLPYWPRFAESAGDASHRIRLFSANVQYQNRNNDELLKQIRETKPLIVSLSEVSPEFAASLSELSQDYPHAVNLPPQSPCGPVFWSKLPITDAKVGVDPPYLRISVESEGKSISIYNVPSAPPISPSSLERRNALLSLLSQEIQPQASSTILLGDLNTSPWSVFFKDFIRQSGLKDSRLGQGLRVSWPSWFPVGMIPIDYCLSGSDFETASVETLSIKGSDHLGLLCELSVP